jgi:formylmethanofuran dehydrogenase subunit E
MIFRSDDPGRDFDRWDAYQTKQLQSCPRCSKCGDYIQDDSGRDSDDELLCEYCFDQDVPA